MKSLRLADDALTIASINPTDITKIVYHMMSNTQKIDEHVIEIEMVLRNHRNRA